MKLNLINKIGSLLIPATIWCGVAFASPLVTPDVPLDSVYYRQLEKMEAMGFITDMPGNVKPLSRYKVARMLAKVNPLGMQPYLKKYYDSMCDEFSDEIAYVIVHEPLVKKTVLKKGKDKNAEQHQEYYAHENNYLVGEKVKLAQSKHFPANVKFREFKAELSYEKHDSFEYKYAPDRTTNNGRYPNATYQPLHRNNNGHRYGEGMNYVGSFELSGSLNEQLAMSVTPRVAWDKEQKGKVSLEEGYMRSHIGAVTITAGKQALSYGGVAHMGSMVLGNNMTPLTTVQLGLVKPLELQDTFLKFLGKVDMNVFVGKMESNRRDRYHQFAPKRTNKERDDLKLLGMRLDVQPTDTFNIGFQRISMLQKFNKDWLTGTNAYHDDRWNDIASVDFRWKFPGVQFYGEFGGEDQAHMWLSEIACTYGIYFPQLTKDGSVDLRLECFKSAKPWYFHGTFGNGWTYKSNIMGNTAGSDALAWRAELNKYLKNGDRIGLTFLNTRMCDADSARPEQREFTLDYSHQIKEGLHFDVALGYAKINNAEGEKGRNENSRYIAAGLRWNY